MQEGLFMSGEVLVVDLLYHQDRKAVALARVDYWSHPPLHLHPRYSRAVLSSLLVKQNIHAIFCGLRHLLLQWDHDRTRSTCRGPPKPPWVCVVQRRSSRRFCCLPMSTCREEGNEQRAGTGVRPSFYGLEEKLGPGQTTGKQLARR